MISYFTYKEGEGFLIEFSTYCEKISNLGQEFVTSHKEVLCQTPEEVSDELSLIYEDLRKKART